MFVGTRHYVIFVTLALVVFLLAARAHVSCKIKVRRAMGVVVSPAPAATGTMLYSQTRCHDLVADGGEGGRGGLGGDLDPGLYAGGQ